MESRIVCNENDECDDIFKKGNLLISKYSKCIVLCTCDGKKTDTKFSGVVITEGEINQLELGWHWDGWVKSAFILFKGTIELTQ